MVLGKQGEVKFSLTFSEEDQGRTVIKGNASTEVNLECQACLENFVVGVSCEINTIILDELEELFDLEQDRAAIVATGKTVSLQDILEDELMIALPMVPRHPHGCSQYDRVSVDCIDSGNDSSAAGRDETYRPFGELASKFKGVDRKEV